MLIVSYAGLTLTYNSIEKNHKNIFKKEEEINLCTVFFKNIELLKKMLFFKLRFIIIILNAHNFKKYNNVIFIKIIQNYKDKIFLKNDQKHAKV